MQQEIRHEKPALSALSKDEIDHPELVLTELFDFAHLPELKKLLWDWLKATVTGTYNKTLNNRERASILLLYEYLEKLLEANHLIHQAHQKLQEQQLDEQRHIF